MTDKNKKIETKEQEAQIVKPNTVIPMGWVIPMGPAKKPEAKMVKPDEIIALGYTAREKE